MAFEREVSAAIAHWAPVFRVPINAAIVHGIIEKESVNGRYTRTSERGGQTSRGPMMVLDSTALSLGASDPSTLEDPATGIWYGVKYLGSLLKRFGGDLSRSVSAYNTGPNASFLNQAYVNDVFAFAQRYSAIALPAALALFVLGWFALQRRPRPT